mgnify:CR=1 FL=1
MEKYEAAEKDYMDGMKYKDIAEKYNTSINTVKSWKKRYDWNRKKGAHKNEKGCTQKTQNMKVAPVQPEDGTLEILQNDELTAQQQMFCIYYSRTFNATQSYLKAYGSRYETAMVNGCMLLRNTKVREEIERLKKIKREQIVAGEEDIVELQMRIAFADMGDILEFKKGTVSLKDSGRVDTQLIKSVKEGQYGVSVQVEDRQKAISWLTRYFLMHPEDKYKAEFDRKRAEVSDNSAEEILKNMETIAEILAKPAKNRSIEDFEEVQEDEQAGAV